MSMLITLYMPTVDIVSIPSTELGLHKELSVGTNAGFNYQDPFLDGKNKPLTVKLEDDSFAYVYKPGVKFPPGIIHKKVLGPGVSELSH
ncbi:MAG: cytochrome oxidase, partial [Gammaproteobacteria bacterium]